VGLPNIMLLGCQNIGEVLLQNPSLLFLSLLCYDFELNFSLKKDFLQKN